MEVCHSREGGNLFSMGTTTLKRSVFDELSTLLLKNLGKCNIDILVCKDAGRHAAAIANDTNDPKNLRRYISTLETIP